MSVHIKVAGVWKEASEVHTKVAGVWKKADDMPVKVSGSWKTGNLFVPPVVTGGTLTSDATYYYRKFTSNGTLSVSGSAITLDYAIISGGGGGGCGVRSNSGPTWIRWASGGGGGGGLRYVSNSTVPIGNHSVVIGAGGAFGSGGYAGKGSPGGNSSFSNDATTVYGGGYGAANYVLVSSSYNWDQNGGNGGSGGGAGAYAEFDGDFYWGQNGVGGYSLGGQGNAGTVGTGGGAGASGSAGGAGLSVFGTTYSAGAGQTSSNANTGAANTGNAGSGVIPSASGTYSGGAGGSGTVIFRYLKTAVGG